MARPDCFVNSQSIRESLGADGTNLLLGGQFFFAGDLDPVRDE